MNDGKTVFAQRFEHIPMNEFRKAVRRYRGEYKVQIVPNLSMIDVLMHNDPDRVKSLLREFDLINQATARLAGSTPSKVLKG